MVLAWTNIICLYLEKFDNSLFFDIRDHVIYKALRMESISKTR